MRDRVRNCSAGRRDLRRRCPHWLLALALPFSRNDRAHIQDVDARYLRGCVRRSDTRRATLGPLGRHTALSSGKETLPVRTEGRNGPDRPFLGSSPTPRTEQPIRRPPDHTESRPASRGPIVPSQRPAAQRTGKIPPAPTTGETSVLARPHRPSFTGDPRRAAMRPDDAAEPGGRRPRGTRDGAGPGCRGGLTARRSGHRRPTTAMVSGNLC